MCTFISHSTQIAGSGKGAAGWFALSQANVGYDHATHSQFDHALLLDFVNPSLGTSARVAVEMDLPSARALVAQLQAAIAAVHDEAGRADDTDWPQILALYDLLRRMSDNPMVTLNHAIAAAMVHGPSAGIELLDALAIDARLSASHRLDAVRAHLLELAGDRVGAIEHYDRAAGRSHAPDHKEPPANSTGWLIGTTG